jgi:GT2 family glycosyltransferase
MKETQSFSVSIVLPNWNGSALLQKNLPSVIAASNGAEIIVADDASSDGSVAMLKSEFPKVKVVTSSVQQGFAGNVNNGVSMATGDIVVLLNTDVRPLRHFLDPLLAHFVDPTVFAVGCLEQSHEKNGIVERGRGLARWEKGYFIHSKGEVKSGVTAWVSGGSGAFRKAVWHRIGGMDTLYNPFYWEDIDLSYTAWKIGYRILFEPKSIVGHFHEQGTIKTSFSKQDVKRIVYRNQFLFIWKNLSDPFLWLSHIAWTPVRLLQAVLRLDGLMIGGYIDAVRMVPRAWSSRARVSLLWKRSDKELSVRS